MSDPPGQSRPAPHPAPAAEVGQRSPEKASSSTSSPQACPAAPAPAGGSSEGAGVEPSLLEPEDAEDTSGGCRRQEPPGEGGPVGPGGQEGPGQPSRSNQDSDDSDDDPILIPSARYRGGQGQR